MKKISDKNIHLYKNLSNYWDTIDGTIGKEELEEVEIKTNQNIKSYVLSEQELILYLHGLLELKQVQQIKKKIVEEKP